MDEEKSKRGRPAKSGKTASKVAEVQEPVKPEPETASKAPSRNLTAERLAAKYGKGGPKAV